MIYQTEAIMRNQLLNFALMRLICDFYTSILQYIFRINYIQKMMEQPRPSLQKLNDKALQNVSKIMPPLISFDQDQQEIVQFHSDYDSHISHVQERQCSVMSTQTEKKKKQMREKVNQYLNHRKTLGAGKKPNRMTYMQEEQQIAGDILDELVLIDRDEKKLDEASQFILAFNQNPVNAINDYIKKGFILSDQPDVVAAYLLKAEGLDKQNLGKFFGDNNQKTLKILHSYCKLLNFKKVQFDRALRILLSKFRLPGESQQIQRVVWQFSQSFFQINQEDYDNPDQLFPLAYAIIMLATDAHNPNQQKKMSKQQFIKNTHGACPSITTKYLSDIYDRILTQKFQTQVSDFQNIYARLTDINTGDFQNTLKLTNQLKKGDIFVKVCRNTNKMVQRKISLSDDQLRIYWKSIDDESEQPRFIQIKDITDLTLGLGSSVMKKNKVPQQFDPMCFTIHTIHRTLDLKAKTNKQRAKWLNYIRAILIKRRESRIQFIETSTNKKYQRQDIEEIWNTQIFPHWDRHWDYKNKKPLVKNYLVRGIEAICCCWRKRPKTSDGFEFEGNSHGLQIKTSKLQTLWRMGLPDNSRKVLWPLIIGNNLALNSAMVQQIRKRTKLDPNFRKLKDFESQAIQISQICRQFRPDLPAIRELLVISAILAKAFPKNQTNNQIGNTANAGLISFINLIHLGHFLPFYRGEKNEIDLRIQLFEFLLEKNSLKVKQHLQMIKLQTRMYLVNWFLTVFSDCFKDEQVFLFRLWDNFLLEGQIYLFKIGIAIVKYYEIELKMCTFHEGLKVLRFPKNTNSTLFFQILNNEIDVKQEYFNSYIDVRKHAIIKTKVQAIPLE